jgi:transposase
MPRTHGYADKGKRCYDQQDWHAKGRVNAIGAILGFSFLTVSLINGSVNSDVFYAWVKQDLLPKLPPKAVVVMDNAPFHKRSDIKQAFDDQHITLEYLPAYSPDLNPIEHKWAQAKSIRRKQRCTTHQLFVQHLDYVNL